MIWISHSSLSRRVFLGGAAAITASGIAGRSLSAADSTSHCSCPVGARAARQAAGPAPDVHLVAGPARVHLVEGPYAPTDVWAYNASVPGPELRFRQGQHIRIAVENRLQEETTVHWHGVRVPNPMDGVPYLTQKPIAPGETFLYEFNLPDAGTFWYHPHQRSFEQVGRGLYGPLIVEEPALIQVDRDVVWVLDDWRLLRDSQIRDDFGNYMDMSHDGRIGDTVTINGRVPEAFPVRAGERLRLRLINAANARIFGLQFEGHEPKVIALDGQPVEPHTPENGWIVLGPAQRADLAIDMIGAPSEVHAVTDGFYQGSAYKLTEFAYSTEPALRSAPLDAPIRLPANPLPEPDLQTAQRHDVVFGGGMMGGMMSSGMMGGGSMGGGNSMGGGMMGGMMGGGMMDEMMGGMMGGGSMGGGLRWTPSFGQVSGWDKVEASAG